MKKSRIVWIVLSVVVVLALILGGTWYLLRQQQQNQAAAQAEEAQRTAYDRYLSLVSNIKDTTLTVTENGRTIGVYDLSQLGLLDQALSDAKKTCGEWDRADPELFATLSAEDKIAWQAQSQRQSPAVTLDAQLLDVSGVLLDLSKEIRVSAKNAYAYFENGAYVIAPEVPGTQLKNDVVAKALQAAVNGCVVSDEAPGFLTLEVADCGAYQEPEITAAGGVFDYKALLEKDAAGVTIPVRLLDQTERLEVAPLVSVDSSGVVQADRAALEQIVAAWAQRYQKADTPYILDSYVEGPVPLDFLLCTYVLDQTALTDLLEAQVKNLDAAEVEAPFLCTRNGESFAIEGTYVEVDVNNQQMTYYKDGEPLVHTDVVTGYPWGYWTPPGLYEVQNKDVDCWLSGPDYNVFVKYWVGFHGPYGIHDASWRTIFGGKKYLSDGSHGCVNTPEEAMRQIFESIEVGTPVVVHDVQDN